MKSSPIYNRVNVAGRTGRDFGADADGFEQSIQVGTSKTNSHNLAKISVRRIDRDNGLKEFIMFLDGAIIKRGILDGKEFEQVSP